MSHHENTRAFSRRHGRGFWNRQWHSDTVPTADQLRRLIAAGWEAHGVAPTRWMSPDGRLMTEEEAIATLREQSLSSPATPAPAHGLAAGTTGAGEGSVGSAKPEQGGADDVATKASKVQEPSSPSPTHSAGGGEVSCLLPFVLLAAADRWATIAVIVIILAGYAVAIIRANRPPRTPTPPRGPFAGRGNPRSRG